MAMNGEACFEISGIYGRCRYYQDPHKYKSFIALIIMLMTKGKHERWDKK